MEYAQECRFGRDKVNGTLRTCGPKPSNTLYVYSVVNRPRKQQDSPENIQATALCSSDDIHASCVSACFSLINVVDDDVLSFTFQEFAAVCMCFNTTRSALTSLMFLVVCFRALGYNRAPNPADVAKDVVSVSKKSRTLALFSMYSSNAASHHLNLAHSTRALV